MAVGNNRLQKNMWDVIKNYIEFCEGFRKASENWMHEEVHRKHEIWSFLFGSNSNLFAIFQEILNDSEFLECSWKTEKSSYEIQYLIKP